MKYFWTLFWTFLLVQMIGYVGGSMLSAPYDFKTAAILGVIATVLVFVVSVILPDDVEGKSTAN